MYKEKEEQNVYFFDENVSDKKKEKQNIQFFL